MTTEPTVPTLAADSNGEVFCPACRECGWFTLRLNGAALSARCQNCGHEIAAETERETRAKVAADLRRAADGRREYAGTCPNDDLRDHLTIEAEAYESAAGIAEDPARLLGLIPSWRWTTEEHAAVDGAGR